MNVLEQLTAARSGIVWTLGGDKDSRYNNWLGMTPFGRILITWKGWKEPHSNGLSVDEFPGEPFFIACDDPEEAKAACEAEYNRRLRAALAQEQRMNGAWLPIETAPRDGTAFLGYVPARRGYVARQDVCPMHWSDWGGGTWESSTSGHRIHDQVTHWMPLPSPPVNA